MYLLIASVFVTNYRLLEWIDNEIKQKFNYFVFVWSKILVGKQTIYIARSRPDNRDIRITDGRITEVQLYIIIKLSLSFTNSK